MNNMTEISSRQWDFITSENLTAKEAIAARSARATAIYFFIVSPPSASIINNAERS